MLEGAKSIGAGAATIASAGAAVGIGNVPSSSIHSVARNPSLAKQLFGYAILGFALTEAIASFAPMMASLIFLPLEILPYLKTLLWKVG
nr:ATPase subunit 9 [Sarcandra glabra]